MQWDSNAKIWFCYNGFPLHLSFFLVFHDYHGNTLGSFRKLQWVYFLLWNALAIPCFVPRVTTDFRGNMLGLGGGKFVLPVYYGNALARFVHMVKFTMGSHCISYTTMESHSNGPFSHSYEGKIRHSYYYYGNPQYFVHFTMELHCISCIIMEIPQ